MKGRIYRGVGEPSEAQQSALQGLAKDVTYVIKEGVGPLPDDEWREELTASVEILGFDSEAWGEHL